MGMHYKRIGREIGDMVSTTKGGAETIVREGEIRLAEMEYGANRELCQRLGVKKLPSIHFYSQGKKVDGFPCGPRKLPMLLEKLTEYRSMGLEDLSFEADMNQGLELGEDVLEILDSEVEKSNADNAFC
jgi:thioredoxin-like negative regulator of GroEL